MFDINLKNVKKGRNFFYSFLAMGIIFFLLIGGIFVANAIKLNSLDSTVLSSNVTIKSHIDNEGTTMYSPVYDYEVNGQKYSCSTNSSSSVNPGTQNKTVYYDSKDPSRCMTEASKTNSYFILLALLIPIVFIVIALINIAKANKRINIILELNQTGKLVKNLPYRLEDTGTRVNNIPIQRPVIDYTTPSGIKTTLYGDARHDKKHYDADGKVDLLIDENNPENYYIDFEINRLSGNLPQDYYQQPYQNNQVGSYNQQVEIFHEQQTSQQIDNNIQQNMF